MRDVPEIGQADAPIVGRERELSVLLEFVRADPAQLALVLSGGPGIGKTTLWEAGSAAARGRGLRVLSARASGAEAQLSFAALIDLLDGVGSRGAGGVPAPQLRALEVALLRAEPTDAPPEPRRDRARLPERAARAGGARAAAGRRRRRPVAGSSFGRGARVRRAAARGRAGRASCSPSVPAALVWLERALGDGAGARLEVGPLSLGATRRMLAERLGLEPAAAGSAPAVRRDARATRSSRSSWAARWPRAGCRRSARTCRCPTRSRTCWARAWTRFRAGAQAAARRRPERRPAPVGSSRRSPSPPPSTTRSTPACSSSTAIACARPTRCSPPRRGALARPTSGGSSIATLAGVGRRRGAACAAPRARDGASGCRACRDRRGRGRQLRPRAARAASRPSSWREHALRLTPPERGRA